MADLDKLVEDLSTLTVLEAADLVKKLEEKWGVSAGCACSDGCRSCSCSGCRTG